MDSSSTPRRSSTSAEAGHLPKPAWREAVELAWHLAVVGVAATPVARRLGTDARLSALAVTLLAAGAAWHVAMALRGHAWSR